MVLVHALLSYWEGEKLVMKREEEIIQMAEIENCLDDIMFWWSTIGHSMMCDSLVTRSMAVGDIAACPWAYLAPPIVWIGEQRRE